MRLLDDTDTEDDLKHHFGAEASNSMSPIARFVEDGIEIVDVNGDNGTLRAEIDIYRYV
jgi:hypothetical protein